VNCPVDVGVVVFIKVFNGFDYLFGFLRGCCVVKVNERVIVYFPFQYWKVFANPVGIEDYFSSATFNLFESIFASSSSSTACFSSKVNSVGSQLGLTPLFS